MNTFDLYIKKILDFPLWVKQVLYLKLLQNMRENLCEEFLRNNPDNVFANYIPVLTFNGQNELQDRKCGFDSNIYNFLKSCKENCSILEICAKHYFSMEETAKYFEFCVEQKFLNQPATNELKAISAYISGKYRVGEYLLEIGRINNEQHSKALEVCKQQPDVKFGDILISLNFIAKDELKSLFILKEEAQKRFVVDYNTLPKSQTEYTDENRKYQKEIDLLRQENTKLKKQMEQLLQVVKHE